MIIPDNKLNISFQLKNIALYRFLEPEEYPGIISPFSRMYLVNEGQGLLVFKDQTIELESGFLYLIPSFVDHNVIFHRGLEHIYIHFTIQIENHLSIYHLISNDIKIPATTLSKILFYRLLQINPRLELPHHDPQIYQTKPWMNKKPVYRSPGHKLETEAIIQQLFSGFITKMSEINQATLLKYNLHTIIHFIHQNLHNDIKIDELSEIACLSKDHFSRIFKSTLGVSPYEYIIRKRIEKSQFLLLSTNSSFKQIIENTNFKNTPYFSRMFKKYTGYTPAEYRKLKFLSV